MKFYRTGLIAGLLAGAVVMTACGSSGGSSSTSAGAGGGGNSGSSGGGSSTCAKGSLKSDGSTAQQNAISAWIKAYEQQCSGANIVYSGGGSGQGVTDFTQGKVNFAGSDSALSPAKGEVAAAIFKFAHEVHHIA